MIIPSAGAQHSLFLGPDWQLHNHHHYLFSLFDISRTIVRQQRGFVHWGSILIVLFFTLNWGTGENGGCVCWNCLLEGSLESFDTDAALRKKGHGQIWMHETERAAAPAPFSGEPSRAGEEPKADLTPLTNTSDQENCTSSDAQASATSPMKNSHHLVWNSARRRGDQMNGFFAPVRKEDAAN